MNATSLTKLEFNWDVGKKRTSNYTGETFLTRKDLRIHDAQFKKPRRKTSRWSLARPGKKTRRAKPLHIRKDYYEKDKGV